MLKLKTFVPVLGIVLVATMSLSAQAAESPPLTEAFGCNFLEGKDVDDLDKVIDYYQAQRTKIDSPEMQKMRSRIWTPFRGDVPYDFVWFNSNMTFNEWGMITDAFDRTKEGQAIIERFNEVVDCGVSALITGELLFSTEKEFMDDGEVMIESYRCELNPGKTIADSDAALAVWKPVFEKAIKATNSASVVARRIPIISGSGFDLSYLAVWDDASAYSAGNSAFMSDPDSASSTRLFAAAHRCQSALFKSRTVVTPAE